MAQKPEGSLRYSPNTKVYVKHDDTGQTFEGESGDDGIVRNDRGSPYSVRNYSIAGEV